VAIAAPPSGSADESDVWIVPPPTRECGTCSTSCRVDQFFIIVRGSAIDDR